jgi:hypothetical protein
MRIKGGWEVAYVRRRYDIVAIYVLLAFHFAVVFILIYFRFRQVNPKLIGDVLMNRQNAAASTYFFSFVRRTPY